MSIKDLPVTERGPWLATSLGGMWSIQHPDERDVFIDDIAAGSARTCRYAGQLRDDIDFFSVAEHAIEMTFWAIENGYVVYLEDALAILLHDASEAYYGDMPTPLKQLLPDFRVLEDMAQDVIISAFGLNKDNTLITKKTIKEIDNRIRVDERPRLIAEPAMSAGHNITWDDGTPMQPLDVTLQCLAPGQARVAFLNCWVQCIDQLPARDPEIYGILKEREGGFRSSLDGLGRGTHLQENEMVI
ncbi:hypothetical protein [Pseudosulfitobacter pseudonitzschiae]|uniref:hypothetical protein n=1 Tax=Pseudosulfitobacter pseudonitzschiae TaxID=1402135 RepID=UPI003B77BF1A